MAVQIRSIMLTVTQSMATPMLSRKEIIMASAAQGTILREFPITSWEKPTESREVRMSSKKGIRTESKANRTPLSRATRI
jgi:hypothetical protein